MSGLVFVTLCLTFVLLFLSQKQIAAATQSPLSAQLRNVVLGYSRRQLSRVARLRTDVPNQLGQLWLAVDPVSLPGHSHSRFRTAVPGFCAALPRFRTAVPGFRAALPHFRTAVPGFRAALPCFRTAVLSQQLQSSVAMQSPLSAQPRYVVLDYSRRHLS